MNLLATIHGKLIDVGDLDHGRGITLEVEGQDVSVLGLTMEEAKTFGALLGEELTIVIRHTNTSSGSPDGPISGTRSPNSKRRTKRLLLNHGRLSSECLSGCQHG